MIPVGTKDSAIVRDTFNVGSNLTMRTYILTKGSSLSIERLQVMMIENRSTRLYIALDSIELILSANNLC
jgi:hypothetical protein